MMSEKVAITDTLRGGLIVSCQAEGDSPFNRPEMIAAFAVAAEMGGARGLRVCGLENLRAVRRVCSLPVIALTKDVYPDGSVLITPTVEEALALWEEGADMVAVDATLRPRGGYPGGPGVVEAIRAAGVNQVVADVSTALEGELADRAGATAAGTTLSGYTPQTSDRRKGPDLELVRELSGRVRIPVFAEGRIWTPDEAVGALAAGAYAVVVGTAITRPVAIVERFADALRPPGGHRS